MKTSLGLLFKQQSSLNSGTWMFSPTKTVTYYEYYGDQGSAEYGKSPPGPPYIREWSVEHVSSLRHSAPKTITTSSSFTATTSFVVNDATVDVQNVAGSGLLHLCDQHIHNSDNHKHNYSESLARFHLGCDSTLFAWLSSPFRPPVENEPELRRRDFPDSSSSPIFNSISNFDPIMAERQDNPQPNSDTRIPNHRKLPSRISTTSIIEHEQLRPFLLRVYWLVTVHKRPHR